MPTQFGVIVFPGSNCDHDAETAISQVLGQEARMIWHKETDLANVDAVILPGGFSYGDYLRSGAIAGFSPIMGAVKEFAASGGLVLGICNGFQVLCEIGLLPGALLRNAGLRFVCKPVNLKVESTNTPFSHRLTKGDILEIPVAHGDGNYFASDDVLAELEANDQIVLRYAEADGSITKAANPNGSVRNIAGIVNEARNVMGMMPHPERHVDPLLGSVDGLPILRSMVDHLVAA